MTNHIKTAVLLLIVCIAACSSPKSPPSAETSQAFDHMAKAVALNNQATVLANQSSPFTQMPQAEFARLKSLWGSSLVEARKVDVALLNAEEPGFGDTFQIKFVRGLELCTEGNGGGDLAQGQLLLGEFGEALTAVKAKKH